MTNDPRRLCVTSYIEGISTRDEKTVEFSRSEIKKAMTILLRPTLLPDQYRRITETQWAMLHVDVEILGSTMNPQTRTDTWTTLVESRDTYPILLLSRNSSFNSVEDPETGIRQDLTRYYAAWVTPHAEPVQALVRRAADRVPDRRIAGYQGRRNPEATAAQVRALFETLKAEGLSYVDSVIDFGAGPGQITQRTRLPRESLRRKSANCIDGTVLMASLLEAASLQPAIVLVPGHAFVAWETWEGTDEWDYLETTMIASHDFEAANQRTDPSSSDSRPRTCRPTTAPCSASSSSTTCGRRASGPWNERRSPVPDGPLSEYSSPPGWPTRRRDPLRGGRSRCGLRRTSPGPRG